ncbi:SpoIIE family protein phosphatase [Streptomyces ipomoeae]|uniref:protein-serine/threonine phosphatase n=2 Tax=Streptomyces ipomoeae TaxID=103232 RepID=L1KZG6_9ACTN|nr:SpoIIE family protein phosphatase [Streptomyces ipomoeae]EKX65855.1 stage II sporulation protein E [Streptomyces ipomoeae 91-03]MDX2698477.1 SpoIIE family protein phosphatase [Streptomyces ipomoeae]MDX2839789.1 SpoIIE family protein phosphatase [Streptomyces ipomoeae]
MVRSDREPIPTGLAMRGTGPVLFRERFLQGEPVETGVRTSILDSWRRCRTLGLSPDQSDLPFHDAYDPDGRIVRAAVPVLDRLQSRFSGSEINISLADANGTVLLRRFGEPTLARGLPAIQRVPGFVFAEPFAGTNGIGLALAERQLIRVYGAEHFAERSQANACVALPVRDPLSGRIEGVLCFGYPRSAENPAFTTVIRSAAKAMERRLLGQSSARERALLGAYLAAGAEAAAGPHHGVALDDLAPELRPGDRALLMEKAAELISRGQRAAVDVPLSDGRRVTLVSRPMESASGVEGIAVEAVLPGPSPGEGLTGPNGEKLAVRDRVDEPPGIGVEAVARVPSAIAATAIPQPARLPVTSPPGRLLDVTPAQAARDKTVAIGDGPPAERPQPAPIGDGPPGERPQPAPSARGLVLLGEPQVGAYAMAARRRLELLSEASSRIGTTLEVRRTAEELAETAVPRLADFVTVDIPEAVLRGEESTDPVGDLRRAVVHGIRDDLPFTPVGKRIEFGPTAPQRRCLTGGQAVLEPDLKAAAGWLAQDPEHTERLLSHVHSLIAVPLVARGVVLGIASFYRAQDPAPFGDDDRSLAQELAARAALCIDNARRYTHERTMVLALQRRLLPHGLPDQEAVEVAHRYLPAESDVSGDWYDVIPLSGARIGLIVGDVVGHGMLSAATMGRLRTAARSFAELDFPPDEVLTHLDNLVARLDREDPGGEGSGIIGATCLYVIYDPTSQKSVMARAGHPPPALVCPDGTVSYPDLPAGPPLGLGGLPFDAVEIDVPANSQLVLYTDGLIEDRHRDVDVVLDQLRGALAHHPERTPEDTCQAILDTVAPAHPCDDIALLVARTHALDPSRIATWELPPDPALVAGVRASALRRLADWGLDDASFAAELILSELVTNAIRHGAGPIRVRLLHDRTLVCEVADASNTAPHLRRAASTDEGGRGLFLVAQLARSWGTRYLPEGKVIWAECGLDGV